MPICSTIRFEAILASPLSGLGPPIQMGAGMRRIIDGEKTFGLDRGVALRGGQAGMAQQLLNGAQVASGVEQMRRKAVPQSMRGGGLRQPELSAKRLHQALHRARVERPAAGADKERALLAQRMRAGGKVIG